MWKYKKILIIFILIVALFFILYPYYNSFYPSKVWVNTPINRVSIHINHQNRNIWQSLACAVFDGIVVREIGSCRFKILVVTNLASMQMEE